MFFRRERPKQITFEDRLESLRKTGFTAKPSGGGRVLVTREGDGAAIENGGETPKIVERPGLLLHGGIAKLVDGGYQKFFLTVEGAKKPALAEELKGVHAFEEDLREALGMQ